MNWLEALDILDGVAVGHRRDLRYRLEALRVISGNQPAGDEAVTSPLADPAQVPSE
jgi:hypothetical protein